LITDEDDLIRVLMLSWEYGGGYVGANVEDLVNKLTSINCNTYILHIAGDEYTKVKKNMVIHGVAPNIKTNLHIITSVFSSLGDYSRAISSITYDIGGFDVIHAHDWLAGIPGFIAKLAYGKPFVLTLYSLEDFRRGDTNLISLSIEGFERYLCDQADALVIHDEGLSKHIVEKYKVPQKKIYVLYEWDGIVDIYKEVLVR